MSKANVLAKTVSAGGVLADGVINASEVVGVGGYQATASGALTNGCPVIVNADGTVSAVTGQNESVASITPPSGFTVASIAGNTSSNTIVLYGSYLNAVNDTRIAAVAGTYNATTRTVTWGSIAYLTASNAGGLTFLLSHSSLVRVGTNAYVGLCKSSSYAAVCTPFTVSGTTITVGTNSTMSFATYASVYSIAAHAPSGVPSGLFLVTSVTGAQTTQSVAAYVYEFSANTVINRSNITSTPATYAVYSAAQPTITLYNTNLDRFYVLFWTYNIPAGSNNYMQGYAYSLSTSTKTLTQTGGPNNVTPPSPGVDSISQYNWWFEVDNINNRYYLSNFYSGATLSPGYQNGALVFGTLAASSVTYSASYPTLGSGQNNSNISGNWLDSANKMLLNYYGTAQYATISGTTVTTSSTTLTTSYASYWNNIDLGSGKMIAATTGGLLAFIDYTLSNATSENFIGFSDNAYSNGQTATIQIIGGVDDAQTSLTPGQSYYLQPNGTIGLAPSVGLGTIFAGTAVASTKIIVKG